LYKSKDYDAIIQAVGNAKNTISYVIEKQPPGIRISDMRIGLYAIGNESVKNRYVDSLYKKALNDKGSATKLTNDRKTISWYDASEYYKELSNLLFNCYKPESGWRENLNYYKNEYGNAKSPYYHSPELQKNSILALYYRYKNESYGYKYYDAEGNYYNDVETFYKALKGVTSSKSILFDSIFDEMLLTGYWSGSGYYFRMYENGNNGKHISYNLPWFDYGDYYGLEDHIIYLFPKNNESARKNLFKFSFINATKVDVYCYQNGKTYTLTKSK
jgi:hypothetical protein